MQCNVIGFSASLGKSRETNKQSHRQTDRQFWESNLTVAEKGNEFQKSSKK